jgi:hypothetical protein
MSFQMLCGLKIIIGLKFINDHLKFNGNFKSHMTFRRK